ncbi:MAG: radical SAM protein, partial [Desulfobacterales bacterium]
MISRLKNTLQQAKVAAGILNQKIYTGPWNVQIDLTNRCNNNCIACWCNSPLLGDKAMAPAIKNKSLSFETAIKLIDELDELGVRAIYFTGGGEPFMHPQILDIMRHIKAKKIHL